MVGASGSGKSTLLKALAGLDRPTCGGLDVAGTSLAWAAPRALRLHRRGVAGYVSQKAADNFVPHLTMREQDDGRAVALLRDFGLGHRIDAKPIELSGGSAAPLLEAVRSHAGAGVAFVIATHDDVVVAIADRVLRLDRGRVVSEDLDTQTGSGTSTAGSSNPPRYTPDGDRDEPGNRHPPPRGSAVPAAARPRGARKRAARDLRRRLRDVLGA